MIIKIEEARYIDNYRLWLRFNTGENGEVDLIDLLHKYPIAKPLLNKSKFKSFYLDEWPTIAWKCGFDVSPETLYERISEKQFTWVKE